MAFNPAKYFREVRQETGKVSWPTRKETLVSGTMVFVIALVAAVFFLVADSVISAAVQYVLGLGN